MASATLSEIIVALLTLAFGAWAGVVAWIGHGIRSDLGRIASDIDQQTEKLNKYIVQTETRLAVVEDRLNNRT